MICTIAAPPTMKTLSSVRTAETTWHRAKLHNQNKQPNKPNKLKLKLSSNSISSM